VQEQWHNNTPYARETKLCSTKTNLKMKKLVFAFCMMIGAVVVNAQDTTSTQSPTDPTSTNPQTQSPMQEDGRVKIKSQELPDAVKSSLESQEYRGWLVNSAYKMDAASNSSTGEAGNDVSSDSTSTSGSNSTSSSTSGDASSSDSTNVSSGNQTSSGAYNKEVYIVELKNGAQTKTVRFDADGKKLDDDGMKDDQK
jgi:hypothetical protein